MAGYERNKQRLEDLQLLGKDLARRSARSCEVCEASGVRLDPWEVPPVADDPSLDRTLLICAPCAAAVAGGALGDAATWRCLENAMWSELPALQVTAILLLRRLAAENVDWAAAALDSVYPSEETNAWLEAL